MPNLRLGSGLLGTLPMSGYPWERGTRSLQGGHIGANLQRMGGVIDREQLCYDIMRKKLQMMFRCACLLVQRKYIDNSAHSGGTEVNGRKRELGMF